MKKMGITAFCKMTVKELKRGKIPSEGLMLTYKREPFLFVMKAKDAAKVIDDLKQIDVLTKEDKEDEVPDYRQHDTFTRVDKPEPEALGICSRCGRPGKVRKIQHLNEHKTSVEGRLCMKCYPYPMGTEKSRPSGGVKEIKRSVPKEMTSNSNKNQSDFGSASVTTTFN